MLRAVIPPVPPSAEWISESKYFEVIDGDDIVDFTTSDVKARQWKDMWYEFTSSPHGSGLLWCAVLLQEEYLTDTEVYINTLVFKVCHACFDGVSSMKFCKQFLYYLNSVASGTLSREADIESLDSMPGLSKILLQQKPWPVWQKCLGLPQIWKVILKAVVRLNVGTVRPKYPFQCLGPTFSSDTEQKQRLISKVFSVEETVELVRACKSNACTVTGALMAIIHMEFCKILDERRLLLPSQLEHYLAINAQRNCEVKPHEEYLGQYYMRHHFFMPFAKQVVDFWKFAKETTTSIHIDLNQEVHIKQHFARLNACNPEDICSKLMLVSDPDEIMSPCNLLSNIGSFNFGKEQHYIYDVDECLLNTQIEKLPGVFYHFITTVNDKLSWVISFNGSRIAEEIVQQFVNNCFNSLSEINDIN